MVWIDQLRGLAILLVVAFHGKTVLGRFVEQVPGPVDVVLDFFAPFRIPLLVFLSGMLLGVALSKPPRRYALGKLRRIAWPYVVWSVLFLVVADRLSGGRLLLLVVDAPPHLWFLTNLLVFYALARLLLAVRCPLAVAAPVSYALSFVPDGYGLRRALFLFVFFVAGHLYAQHHERLTFRPRRAWLAVSALVATASAVASAAGADLKYEPELVLAPVSGIVLCLLVAPHGVPARAGRALAYVGRDSIVFYVVHYPALWAFFSTLTGLGVREVLPMYAAGCAVALAAGAAFSAGRQRSRFVDALFACPAPAKARIG
jgi:surface polysaccharide O-acyltransferase-like enzyme